MFKSKFRKKSSASLFQNSCVISESFKRNNTSTIVNGSDDSGDELPLEIVSVLTEEGLKNDGNVTYCHETLSPKTQPASGKAALNSETTNDKKGRTLIYTSSSSTDANEGILEKQNQLPYFEELLKTCGAVSLNDNSSYMLSEDQTILSLKINDILKQSNYKITCFLNSLREVLDIPDIFQKMLAHTLTSDDCEVARGPVQESIIRILLDVACLQKHLIDILLQKLGDFALNSENNRCYEIASLILRQMRFLNLENDIKIAPKLFEVIYKAPTNLQREIIFMMPEIITPGEMEEVSVKLVDMLKEDNDLTNVILDSITNFFLNKTVLSEVRLKAFSRLDKCAFEFVPSLVQFILCKCEEDECVEVVNGLRQNLPLTAKHLEMRKSRKQEDETTYLKTTFDILKFSALSSKLMADAWIKAISSVNCPNQFRSLDLMMLIVLNGNLYRRKNQIISLIRSKIKSLILTESQIFDLFKTLKAVLAEYFSDVLEIATILIKSIDPIIVNVGAVLYKECFTHFHFNEEQAVINEILLHIAMGLPTTINTVLLTLKYFCENHKETLSRHTTAIVGLINKTLDLSAPQIRIVMDIISDIVFSDLAEDGARWQDEVQIFIRKQIMSSKLEISKRGIIAAIALGKRAGQCHVSSEFEQTNNFLVMIMDLLGTNDLKRTFFNDEFATMLLSSQLSQPFLDFWARKIQKTFASTLLAGNMDITCKHFATSLQYPLYVKDEDSKIFPVIHFVTLPLTDKTPDISLPLIPSAFKLLWCCVKNLDSTLFSASIAMPEVTVLEKFQILDDKIKKIILDCLFLCINYLIECVNAFCFHNILDKATFRLVQLLEVQKEISRLLPLLPHYLPVNCQFYSPIQKFKMPKTEKLSKKGKKRKAEDPIISLKSSEIKPGIPSQSTAIDDPIIPSHVNKNEENDNLAATYSSYFRELHVNCLKLLKVDLSTTNKYAIHNDYQHFQPSSKVEICTADASFLLEDGIKKCKNYLGKTKGDMRFKEKQVLQKDDCDAGKFASLAISILPSLMKKMEIWSDYCRDLLLKNEGIFDGPGMYSKDSRYVKLALANALAFIAEIISWPGLHESINNTLLKQVLNILARNGLSESENCKSLLNKMAKQAARYLTSFGESVLVLSGGMSIVKAVRACLGFGSSDGSLSLLADLCFTMLCKKWYTVMGAPEKGTIYNQNVNFLIKTYFSVIDDPLEAVKEMATTVIDEAVDELTDKNSCLKTIKSVNRYNFSILYRGMCDALVSASPKELEKTEDARLIQIWGTIVETLLILVNIAKISSSRTNLAALLKNSQSIIQLFFAKGLPAVELALRTNSIETLKLLKTLQTVTRFLHSVCCHSKLTNDFLIATHVPAIRAQCERLTLEVKGMLISNKIPMECITIAILKNKDIEGNDILSQETLNDYSDSDSEMPTEEPIQLSEEDEDMSSHSS